VLRGRFHTGSGLFGNFTGFKMLDNLERNMAVDDGGDQSILADRTAARSMIGYTGTGMIYCQILLCRNRDVCRLAA